MKKTKPSIPGDGVRISLEALTHLHHLARRLQLSCNNKVFTQQAGDYLSQHRGRGMDFEEVRHYQPGDDIRTMDWRVTARTGKPHTKIFHEEKERPILLVVDFSPTMFFATRGAFKSVIGAQAAALLAWSGCQHGDRVGGIVFSGETFHEFRPKTKKQGVLPLLKALSAATEQLPTQQNNSFEKALYQTRHVAKPGSLVIVISDFFNLTETAQQHLGSLKQHCELINCWITDPIEFSPPPAGRYTITDGQAIMTIDTRQEKFCQEYQALFQKHHNTLQETVIRYRIPLVKLSTDSNVSQCLQQYFGA